MRTFTVKGKTYNVTHQLKIDIDFGGQVLKKGEPVHLVSQRKDPDGWKVLVVTPTRIKRSNTYGFAAVWGSLEKADESQEASS